MTQRYITLGDGRHIGLGRYVMAWKQCLALEPKTHIGRGIDGWGQTAGAALVDLRYGLHDRINKHIPGYGVGRKWDHDWQRAAGHLAARANSRCSMRAAESRWIAPELRARLAHRITED